MDRGTVTKKLRKRRKSNTDNIPQQAENEPVYFSNDTILEAVKFLNYEKWSQMRFLCHRVNQLIHSNQANLQAFEVKSLSMSEYPYKSNSIVSFAQRIHSANAMRKWFQDLGYSCDETTDMPLKKVFVGMNPSKGNGLHLTIRALFQDFSEKNMPLTRSQAKQMRIRAGKENPCLSDDEILRSKSHEVFSAEFNAKYEFSGPILSHFFRLLYHPAAYFRQVSMFTPMTDKFCDMTSHSPIRCNQFTLLDSHSSLSYISLEHSLKWLQDNVRAQNITLFLNENNNFPYPDVHSLVSEFFLQNGSICVKDRIKLDRLLYPEEFVKNLIKKYETLEVTDTIPSIVLEFRLHWNQGSLEVFLRDLEPMDYPPLYDKCDSCDIKTYGRQNKLDVNRKIIAQFGRCLVNRCLYYGSTCYTILGMDRGTVAKKSRKRRKNNTDNTSQQEKELVFLEEDDTILEAVKFLNYEKWSKMRFLCHRVNQLIHSNQSKLQVFEVKSLSIGEVISRSSNSIVNFDEVIKQADAVTKWFQDLGYLCDKTANMPLEKVFTGMNLSEWNGLHITIRAFYEEYRERNMPLTRAEAKRTGKFPKIDRCLSNSVTLRSKPPVVFSAKLDAKYEFYGPILSHFFRLLHHPAAYFREREVSTFPPMTDKFCDITSLGPIRCEQFTLHHLDSSLRNSLQWLKDNVRAQNIRLAINCMHKMSYPDLHSLLLEFILLLDASICARDHIKLFWLPHPGEFVKALIKKYETLEVTKAIPSILIEDCPSEIPPGYYQYLESIMVRQDDPIVADKFCDKCNVKSYQLQNKMDGNRKMILQVGRCVEPRCDGYIDPIVYMKFE